jgi:hypothetical protein
VDPAADAFLAKLVMPARVEDDRFCGDENPCLALGAAAVVNWTLLVLEG